MKVQGSLRGPLYLRSIPSWEKKWDVREIGEGGEAFKSSASLLSLPSTLWPNKPFYLLLPPPPPISSSSSSSRPPFFFFESAASDILIKKPSSPSAGGR